MLLLLREAGMEVAMSTGPDTPPTMHMHRSVLSSDDATSTSTQRFGSGAGGLGVLELGPIFPQKKVQYSKLQNPLANLFAMRHAKISFELNLLESLKPFHLFSHHRLHPSYADNWDAFALLPLKLVAGIAMKKQSSMCQCLTMSDSEANTRNAAHHGSQSPFSTTHRQAKTPPPLDDGRPNLKSTTIDWSPPHRTNVDLPRRFDPAGFIDDSGARLRCCRWLRSCACMCSGTFRLQTADDENARRRLPLVGRCGRSFFASNSSTTRRREFEAAMQNTTKSSVKMKRVITFLAL